MIVSKETLRKDWILEKERISWKNIYGWGYLLLFKSDCANKIRDLEAELKKLISLESSLTPAVQEPELTVIPPSSEN